jgi:hypothetical protein
VTKDQSAVDATAEEVRADEAPMPEAEAAVEAAVPSPAELVVRDPSDAHEVYVVLDAHDEAAIVRRAQESALKKWVYEFPQDGKMVRGLSIDGVQDVIQQMNWSGRTRIGVLEDTLKVESATADEGGGDEPYWIATIFARDDVTGMTLPGSSMEPQRMKRRNGAKVFDRFARTKAISKAARNALAGFIPETLEQSIIAMYAKDPSRVERIQTEAEAKLAELPPPLDDEEARALLARADAAYAEIVWPEAHVEFPPAKFGAWKLHTQHSHEMLRELVVMVEAERDRLAAKYGGAS